MTHVSESIFLMANQLQANRAKAWVNWTPNLKVLLVRAARSVSLIVVTAQIATTVALSATSVASAESNQNSVIAITSIVEHPSLNEVRRGIVDGLAEAGFQDGSGVSIVFKSAMGQASTAVQIAREFAAMEPALIIAISTLSAQATLAASRDVSVVFAAVTDPVGAKLVASLDVGSGTVTGTSDLVSAAQEVQLVRRFLPNASAIGLISNPGEVNSLRSVQAIQEAASRLGFEALVAPTASTAGVLSATQSLVGKVDAIFVHGDNTVVSALPSVMHIAEKAQIPVFAGHTEAVNQGAVAALGFDYYRLGQLTGKIAVRVLNGEEPGSIPIQTLENLDIAINLGAARRLGLEIPSGLLAEAITVVE